MDLLLFPDLRLRSKCKPVEAFTPEVKKSLDEMMDRMDEWGGVGLAAPQCGLSWRMFVTHLPGQGRLAFINPTLEDAYEGYFVNEERCLSLPGASIEIMRPAAVRLHAMDYHGEQVELLCRDLTSICMQHEVDHLNGVLILDRANPIDRRLALLKVWNAEHPKH